MKEKAQVQSFTFYGIPIVISLSVSILAMTLYVGQLPGSHLAHLLDVVNFLLLTIPFAIGIAAFTPSILNFSRTYYSRLLLPVVMGSIIGTVWAILCAFALWPLFREIDLVYIPVTWFWMLGACASLYSLELMRNSALTVEPETKFNFSKKTKLILIGASFILLLFFWVYLPIRLVHSVFAESIEVIVPYEYQGPILIIYDQETGVPMKTNGWAKVYSIPENGVLKTQSSQGRLATNWSFWYVEQQSNALFSLPYALKPNCDDYLPADPVMVCYTFTQSDSSLAQHSGFVIGRYSDRDRNLAEFRELFNSVDIYATP